MATQTKSTQTNPTLVKDSQRRTSARQPHPGAVHDAADTAGVQAPVTGMTTQAAQELIVQLMRHGLNLSLRSLQMWADLARQLGPTPLDSTATAAMVCFTCDAFEKLLAAQREIVDQFISTQSQLAQRFFVTIPVSDHSIPR